MIVDKKERQTIIDNKNNTLSLCVKTLQEEKIFEIPMDGIKQITYVVNLEEEQRLAIIDFYKKIKCEFKDCENADVIQSKLSRILKSFSIYEE